MIPRTAVAFVKRHGIVLESARGPVPSLAEAIAGAPIRGSWWAHPKARLIYACSRAVRESPDVLVCRLVGGKLTYVHRRLWPAVARLARRFDARHLAAVRETHTASGRHEVTSRPFEEWLSDGIKKLAKRMTQEEAASRLPVGLGL